MISGISKKVIFFLFLFVNFIQPSKSSESLIINNRNTQLTRLELFRVENYSNSYINAFSQGLSKDTDNIKFLKKKRDSLLVAKANNQQELIIQSEKQTEISDVIYAEGNVSVSYKGKLFKADKLIYDKFCLLYTSPSPRDTG